MPNCPLRNFKDRHAEILKGCQLIVAFKRDNDHKTLRVSTNRCVTDGFLQDKWHHLLYTWQS
jgi:hypothetical protein